MRQGHRLLNCILIVVAMLPLQGCARDYSAKSIEAMVVDAETKQPLNGVVIVGAWYLEYGPEGGHQTPMHIMEAVTDKAGRFYFAAWGPKKIPEGLPHEARLKSQDPELVLFLPGYKYDLRSNNRPIKSMGGHGDSVRSSDWNGKTIELKKFKGDMTDYARNLENVWTSLIFLSVDPRDCEWKLVPRMIATLNKESQAFIDLPVQQRLLAPMEIGRLPRQAQCGSAPEFFKEYIK